MRLPSGNTYPLTVKAGTTTTVASTGTQVYLQLATQPVSLRVRGYGGDGGYSDGLTTGKGFESSKFEFVDIKNENDVDVVILLWIGDAGFIDKTLILPTVTQQAAYPTFPVANASESCAINDLSGSDFTDLNGKKWVAINPFRVRTGAAPLKAPGVSTGTIWPTRKRFICAAPRIVVNSSFASL